MPLPYRNVSDLYRTLKDAGVVSTDLPSWSAEMNRLSQSDLYDAGLHDNFIKQASTGLDRLLESTGLPQLGGDVGEAVGGAIGAPDVGRSIGQGIPRMGVGMLGFLGGPVTGAATLGALSGADTYTATGSPAAGLVSGAVNAAMPAAMQTLEGAAFRKLGGRFLSGPLSDAAGNVTSVVKNVPLGTTGQKLGAFGAGQFGAAAFGEAGSALGAGVDPNAEYEFDPKAALLNATLGQAPFTALHLAGKVMGRTKETMSPQVLDAYLQSSAKNIEIKMARDAMAEKSPLESRPRAEQPTGDDINLTTQADIDARIDRITKRKAEIIAEPTADNAQELSDLTGAELEARAESMRGGRADDTLLGRTLVKQENPATDPTAFKPSASYPRELKDALDKLQTGMSFDDFSAVVHEINDVHVKNGEPPLSDEKFRTYGKAWGITNMEETVRGKVNAQVLDEAHVVKPKTNPLVAEQQLLQEDPETYKLVQQTLYGKPAAEGGTPSGRDPNLLGKVIANWKDKVSMDDPNKLDKLMVMVRHAKSTGGESGPKLEKVKGEAKPMIVAKIEKAVKEGGVEVAHAERQRAFAAREATSYVFQREFGGVTEEQGVAQSGAYDKAGVAESGVSDLADAARQFQLAYLKGEHNDTAYAEYQKLDQWKEWERDADEYLVKKADHSPTPMVSPVPKIDAGGGFVHDLVPYDEVTNKLGKHTLRPSSVLSESQFKEMAGESGQLPDLMLKIGKSVVPEAFDGQGNVNVRVLMKGLKEKGPVVEVKKLGGNAKDMRAQITHDLNTRFPGWQDRVHRDPRSVDPEEFRLRQEMAGLGIGGNNSDAKYSFLGPKQNMLGYVEILGKAPGYKGKETHWGDEHADTIFSVRAYEETLPDGGKALHVIEVQATDAQAGGTHPLNKVYETLALKAAIDHARSIGAEEIIIQGRRSTSMMEGHDKAVQPRADGQPLTEADIKQFGGMAIHYPDDYNDADTGTLGSAMKKLTGDKGELVDLGVHDKSKSEGHFDLRTEQQTFASYANAVEAGAKNIRNTADGAVGDVIISTPKPEGSPVFRNADGTPKSSITGRRYKLSAIQAKFAEQGGATLTNPSRAPGPGGADAVPWVPQGAEETARHAALYADSGGVGLVQHLIETATTGAERTLAETIQREYPESLQRVAVRVLQMSREGYAQGSQAQGKNVDVVLSHGIVMSNDPVRSFQVKMHELLHGLSINELDNPNKKGIVQELDQLRQRLIAALPVEIRGRLQDALTNDWYSSFSRGSDYKGEAGRQAVMGDLGTGKYQQIVYGLLNNKELLTQGFTAKQMQDYMAVLRGPGVKGFGVFVEYIKRHLGFEGKVSNSELAHFMDASSRLLKEGNYVSDFADFTDQWFAQKGLLPDQVRQQSQRALEVVQSANVAPDRLLMLTTLAQREPLSNEYREAKAGLDKMWTEGGQHVDDATKTLSEMNVPTGELDGALVSHITDHNGMFHESMDVLPEQVTSYLFSLAKDYKSVLEGVAAAVSEKNDGLINIANPGELRSPVQETLRALDRFLKLQNQQQVDRGLLMAISAPPDAFFNSVQHGLSRVPEAFDAIDEGVPMNKVEKWITQPAQIAMANPLYAEWFSRIILMPGKIREQTLASMRFFSRPIMPDGTMGPENDAKTLDRRYKLLESRPLQKAIDRLIGKKQEIGKDTGKTVQLDYNGPEFKEITKDMKPDEVKNLIEFDNIIRLSKAAADQQQLDAMRQDFAMLGARFPMKSEGMKLNVANDAATRLFDALNSDFNDPAKAAAAQANITMVQQSMQPQSFLDLLKFTENTVAQHKAWAEHLAQNSDWVTASRMKDFKFEYFDGNERVSASANSRKDAEAMAKTKDLLNWRKNERTDDDMTFAGADMEGFVNKIRGYESNWLEALQREGLAPEDMKQHLSTVAQIERDLNYQNANLGDLPPKGRTLGKGADRLPWFENHLSWIEKNATYWQRRLLRTTAESLRQEPGTAGTETSDLIKQHLEEFMQRDPETGRAIQKVASVWSLGFGVASQIANSTQTWMRGVTELIALGHGPVAAVREMKGAWADLIGKRINDEKLASPVENKFLTEALHDGMLDATITDENAQANELSAVKFKQILNAERPKTLGQYLGSAAGAYSTVSMAMFKSGEYMNNKVQLLATFRSLQKLRPELSYPELKKQAYLVNASVNDVGGRANRSLGPYSGKGDFSRTIAMSSMSLQSYTLGSTMQLVRNLKKGLLRSEGLTPSEVYSARKAAVYQLAVQFAAAGTLGMPFVSGAMALLNQAFPELELNKNLRLGVSSLFGSDSENGHILSDIALSGVPSMMGWDFSSRLNAGNQLPGVSEYNGFQPEQLLGVPASIVSRFVQGGKQLASGNGQGGYAFVPPAFKKITELLAEGGVARDYRGRPTLAPTPGESLGLAIGFQPKRLSDYNAADRMAQQSEHLSIVRKGQETRQLAEQALKGNFGTVRQSLNSQMQADKSYNPADAVRSIARVAEEMTFPKDLRREGSRRDMDSRSKLLSSFSLDPTSVSEVQRLQFRRQVEQRLGLMSQDSGELKKAQLMDQLRMQDPTATRAALSAAAQSALRRMPASSLGLQ